MTRTEIIILVIITAVILLLVFLPGKAKAEGIGNIPPGISCQTKFFAKLSSDKIKLLGNIDGKYYKQDVTLDESGITNDSDQISITKNDFDGFCQYIYHPPYDWYKNAE